MIDHISVYIILQNQPYLSFNDCVFFVHCHCPPGLSRFFFFDRDTKNRWISGNIIRSCYMSGNGRCRSGRYGSQIYLVPSPACLRNSGSRYLLFIPRDHSDQSVRMHIRHILHCQTRAPADLKISIRPSCRHVLQTSSVAGTIFSTTPGATFLPFRIRAASRISSILPLVQLPIKTESIFDAFNFFHSTTWCGWPGRDTTG